MLTIVYDMDDVLNNLNDYVSSALEIPIQNFSIFNISKIDTLTENEKRRILEMYSNPNTFKHLAFRDSAYRIFNAARTGKANVFIHSNNFKQEIADVKTKRILAEIPGAKIENISMTVASADGKRAFTGADIIVEDGFENCLRYESKCMKILIDKPWNQCKTYGYIKDPDDIIRVGSLREAVNIVDSIVRII